MVTLPPTFTPKKFLFPLATSRQVYLIKLFRWCPPGHCPPLLRPSLSSSWSSPPPARTVFGLNLLPWRLPPYRKVPPSLPHTFPRFLVLKAPDLSIILQNCIIFPDFSQSTSPSPMPLRFFQTPGGDEFFTLTLRKIIYILSPSFISLFD